VPVPSIERTLVKSPPELWELVDDHELMERWSAELLDATGGVRVVEREPGERLVWEVPADGDPARIELLLAEKGWGTTVSIRVAGPGARSDDGADSHLEQLLDELGSPQRQPFTRT
jgi:uncharacterized protein YndB with AHSA1/START domain